MLALCPMFQPTNYAKNYAGIMRPEKTYTVYYYNYTVPDNSQENIWIGCKL